MIDRELTLLRHLTSDWAGTIVDEDGLVRILNQHGHRPPLIWCFNAANEFPTLARSLGSSQPIIGLRSLHMVTRLDGTRLCNDDVFADYYSRHLLSRTDLSTCYVGGNCQGAPIAARIAANLLASGRNIRALISMEAQPLRPFPGRVEMIFGADSDFNPIRRGEAPEAQWRNYFDQTLVNIIPGAHGEFFSDTYHAGLSQALKVILDRPAHHSIDYDDQLQVIVSIVEQPQYMDKGTQCSLPVEVRSVDRGLSPVEDAVLAFQWISANHGLGLSGKQALPMKKGLHIARHELQVQAPNEPGEWSIELFVCRVDRGPLSWAENRATNIQIQII